MRFAPRMSSPLKGVSNAGWQSLVRALDVQAIDAISASGGLGSYDMRPRRLEEIGLMTNLRTLRTLEGRQVHEGDFVAPMTRDSFLKDPLVQYQALVKSMTLYYENLGSFKGLSRSATLAVLHRGGRGALSAWPNLFTDTASLVVRCQAAF